jgi:hypothetical protein
MMNPDQLRETAEYYDNADLSEHIEQASWEDPSPMAEPMVTYALRLPQPVIDQLRAAAEQRGVKVSTLMREWLEERLTVGANYGEEATVPVSALLALVAERGTGHLPQAS